MPRASNNQRLVTFSNALVMMVAQEVRDENGDIMPHVDEAFIRHLATSLRLTADYAENIFGVGEGKHPIDRERSEQGGK